MTEVLDAAPIYEDAPLEVPVPHPDGSGRDWIGDDKKPIKLHLISPKSRTWQREKVDYYRSLLDEDGNAKAGDLTEDERFDRTVAFLARAVKGWSANFTVRGEKPEYSREQAEALLRLPAPFFETVDMWLSREGKPWAVLSKQGANGARGEAASTGAKAAGGAGDKS